jgi:hypothetical protein
MGGVIFLAAGHWTIGDYWQAWVYVIVFTLISLVTTIYLIRNDPELLSDACAEDRRPKNARANA